MSLLMNISILSIVLFTNFLLTTSKRHASGHQRMINGQNADIENWTFLAQLVFEPDYFYKTCSATLYTRKNLITAAHCVDKLRNKPDKLRVKIPTRTKPAIGGNEWTTTTYEVKIIIVHQKFGNLSTWDNDIALIGLKRPVPKYIKPANMANIGDKLKNCKSAGWGTKKTLNDGHADVANKNYNISEILQEISVPLVPWGKCKDPFTKTHEEFAKLNKMVFCGGSIGKGKEHKTGGCIGDSGSPLICDGPKGKVFSGVMLGGNPSCVPGKHYMIFTDVAKQKREWL